MDPEARRYLWGLYRGQLERLEELLGRDLPWGEYNVSATTSHINNL